MPTPRIETVTEENIEIPPEVRSPDFPAQRMVVHATELSIDELKGEDVFAEAQNFFLVDGKKRQVIHLDPGMNEVYLLSVVNGKRRLYKKMVLVDIEPADVPGTYPDAGAIRAMCRLRIMGPYADEGGVFLPENGVPIEELSLTLQQAAASVPGPVTFSRSGGKGYVSVQQAIDAIEHNFGAPDIPWTEILGADIKPDQVLTRAELARMLSYLKPVQDTVQRMNKEYSIQ